MMIMVVMIKMWSRGWLIDDNKDDEKNGDSGNWLWWCHDS